MPFCPQCGYQYREGTEICPDCREPLMPGQALTCEFCLERLEEDRRFCSQCGMVQAALIEEGEEIECENHPEMEAVGICVVCGKPVCGDCAVKRQGRIFCENDEHTRIAQGWAVLCTTSTEYEAHMVRANLESGGIPCIVFSQRDHAYFLTVGDLAVVNVMVPKHRVSEARDLLKKMNLFEEGSEMTGDEE